VRFAPILRDALAAVTPRSPPRRVAVTAGDSTCTAEIQTAGPLLDGDPRSALPDRLKASAAEAGISFAIKPTPVGTRLTWSASLDAPAARPAQAPAAAPGRGALKVP
jgi:hypothetical protein